MKTAGKTINDEKVNVIYMFLLHTAFLWGNVNFKLLTHFLKKQVLAVKLPVPRLRGRLGQVRCRKASWGCFGGRHLLEFFVALCFGRCGQM